MFNKCEWWDRQWTIARSYVTIDSDPQFATTSPGNQPIIYSNQPRKPIYYWMPCFQVAHSQLPHTNIFQLTYLKLREEATDSRLGIKVVAKSREGRGTRSNVHRWLERWGKPQYNQASPSLHFIGELRAVSTCSPKRRRETEPEAAPTLPHSSA